ncbi:MAG: C1 family peptidase [Chloroflexi bacterium]|nr:C1 family peptidase [Chloroflexota bacterium]
MITLEPTTLANLGPEQLQQFKHNFESDPRNRQALNAVTKNPVHSVAVNREKVNSTNHVYSHVLKTNDVTSQERSGRCWLFAGLNLFRVEAMKRLNVEKLELSQSYLFFWDKLEKSHYFLENILATLDEPADGRLIMFLLQNPIQDGGQWDMFVNLVRKYGVVPKSAMPETESSSNSGTMTSLVTNKLREFAAELRRRASAGEAPESLRQRKMEMMEVIYRMLCIHLGEPPQTFYWQWRDKDDQFHRDGDITPLTFYERYVDYDLDSLVCLIHCPTEDKPFNHLYTIGYLGNVVEGQIIRYLNVEMDVFKGSTRAMLLGGKPVWFGCDVGKRIERDLGILDMDLYDYNLLYGTDFTSDKAERITYGQSMMTHAMVFTGINLDEQDRPTKWRVENSWGEKIGDKGFLVMSDPWFEEFVYEVLVEKRFLPDHLQAILETEPVVLPPWDPMGALAQDNA